MGAEPILTKRRGPATTRAQTPVRNRSAPPSSSAPERMASAAARICAGMATRDEAERLPIGEVLKRTRTRLKLDIGRVEKQTKIRAKYLRGLENEEWDTLPGPTYVKGFLRTYATYLGLDADAIVDEYRRTIERSPAIEQPYLFSEPLLERRRRPAEPRRRSRGSGFLVLGGIG